MVLEFLGSRRRGAFSRSLEVCTSGVAAAAEEVLVGKRLFT